MMMMMNHIIITSSSSASASHHPHFHHHNFHHHHFIIIIFIIIINSRIHKVDCSFVKQPGCPILSNQKSGDGWKNKNMSCISGYSFQNVPISRSKWHPPFENWSTLRLFNHHLLFNACWETPCISCTKQKLKSAHFLSLFSFSCLTYLPTLKEKVSCNWK